MPENTSRSFVVRIWLEPREFHNKSFQLRGMIQDVMSGEKKYFRKFDDMVAFVILQLSKDIQEIGGSEQ
jgi:hypothetical protein